MTKKHVPGLHKLYEMVSHTVYQSIFLCFEQKYCRNMDLFGPLHCSCFKLCNHGFQLPLMSSYCRYTERHITVHLFMPRRLIMFTLSIAEHFGLGSGFSVLFGGSGWCWNFVHFWQPFPHASVICSLKFNLKAKTSHCLYFITCPAGH